MCQASVVNAYISCRMYINARYCTSTRILFARSRRRSGAYIFFDSLCLLPWHSEARKYPVEYHARSCNRSRLEYSSRERHSLVLRQCQFSKTSIGYVGDATPRRENCQEGDGVYDNEFLGDSITRRWNSIGICCERERLFFETMHLPFASPCVMQNLSRAITFCAKCINI